MKKLNQSDKIKTLENRLNQTIDAYLKGKKALTLLSEKHFKASGIIITVRDLSGNEKLSVMLADGFSENSIKSLNEQLDRQIKEKLDVAKLEGVLK